VFHQQLVPAVGPLSPSDAKVGLASVPNRQLRRRPWQSFQADMAGRLVPVIRGPSISQLDPLARQPISLRRRETLDFIDKRTVLAQFLIHRFPILQRRRTALMSHSVLLRHA
jgi:hypothetical protein